MKTIVATLSLAGAMRFRRDRLSPMALAAEDAASKVVESRSKGETSKLPNEKLHIQAHHNCTQAVELLQNASVDVTEIQMSSNGEIRKCWQDVAKALKTFACLTKLDISHSELTGTVAAELLARTPGVQELDLSSNVEYSIGSDKLAAALGNMPKLTNLKLYFADLSGSLAAELLAKTPGVEKLYLTHNRLSNGSQQLAAALGNMTKLTKLDIRMGGNLTGAMAAELLASTPMVKELDLSGNKKLSIGSEQLAAALGNMTKLTKLDIRNSNLNGTVAAELLASTPRVELLDLSSNKNLCIGSQELAAALGNMTKLTRLAITRLDITQANLTGAVASQLLANTTGLTALDLSGIVKRNCSQDLSGRQDLKDALSKLPNLIQDLKDLKDALSKLPNLIPELRNVTF